MGGRKSSSPHRGLAGSQFDPLVVEVFLKVMKEK